MLRLLLALLVALGACTSFEDIARDVCGNGIVEAGEDCDSSDPRCVRCAVTCNAASECPNADYACGVDGVCHAPSGALAAPQPAGPFQVDEVAITDLDKDGIGDVFGVSRTSITVRYGDQGAKLTRAESLITPSHSGASAFGDIDGDGALDLVAPTEDGVIAYTSRYGLAPLAVGSPIAGEEEGDLRYLFKVGRLTVAALLFDETGDGYMLVFDFLLGASAQPICPGITRETFSPRMVDVYKAGDADYMVSITTIGAQPKLCVVSLHRPLFNWNIATVTPANAPGQMRRATLADLDKDNDPCPGLVTSDGGADMLRHWAGSMTVNGCTLTVLPTTLAPAGAGSSNAAVGHIAINPPIGNYAPDLLVMSDGVYGYDTVEQLFVRLYTSQRRLAGADSADLDLDGMTDGILIPESEDDLDILYRRTNSILPVIPGYLLSRIDTASRVVDTEIADFDGDSVPDVAYVEQLVDYQRMMAAYSNFGALLPPVPVGAFSSVSSLSSASLPTSEDAAALTEDIFVVQPPQAGQSSATLTIMAGSALRTMVAYFDPRFHPEQGDNRGSQRETTRLRSIVIGKFAGDARLDTFAIAVDNEPADDVEVPSLAWRMEGTPFGPNATETMGLPMSGFSDCVVDNTGLCVRDARYIAWPSSDDKDVVIAVDRSPSPKAMMFDASTPTIQASALPMVSDKLPAMSVVRSIHATDLDGDGARELVIASATRAGGEGESALLVCQMSDAAPTACEDLVPAIRLAVSDGEEPLTSCVDAAPGRITPGGALADATAGSDLIALCRIANSSALYRVRRTGGGFDVSLLARTSARLEGLRVGDVTGDGVDDVLAIEGESGAQSLVVFPQCDSRDLASCQRSASAAGTQGGGA
ncbi:MAG: VCBS repeat-containing protein [Kofleriaceae bacterium]|nr:VCBS repeat-containing protein [Kofleriaceae bacterium]